MLRVVVQQGVQGLQPCIITFFCMPTKKDPRIRETTHLTSSSMEEKLYYRAEGN